MIRLAFLLLLLLPAAASAAPADGAAVRIVDGWLLPRTAAFADAAVAQAQAWSEACNGKESAGVDRLNKSFQATADTWAAIEHLTLGPSADDLRADRIAFFPDRRNAIVKAMGSSSLRRSRG